MRTIAYLISSAVFFVINLSFMPVEAISGQDNISDITAKSQNIKRTLKGLVYATDESSTCEIKYWDIDSKNITKLLNLESCPKNLVVSGKDTIFITTDKTFQEIRMAGETQVKPPQQLPTPKIKKGNYPAVTTYIGFLPDESFAAIMVSSYPTDDFDRYLYILKQGIWELKEKIYCSRFNSPPCKFQYEKDRAPFSSDESAVWHDNQKENPYVTGRKFQKEKKSGDETYTTWDLLFEINGKRSILTYVTMPGPDTGAIETMGVKLKVEGKETMVLHEGQCETELMGRYLLLKHFGIRGSELVDLENGKSLLSKIKLTRWIYGESKATSPIARSRKLHTNKIFESRPTPSSKDAEDKGENTMIIFNMGVKPER